MKLRNLYRRFFPRIVLQENCLFVNDKQIPGSFEKFGEKEYIAIFDSFYLKVKRSNINYYLSHGTLWWGWKSALVDGIKIEKFKNLAKVVLKLKLNKIAVFLREQGGYFTFLPKDITDEYEMYINGVLIEGYLFNYPLYSDTIYESENWERTVGEENIKRYLSTGSLW